jgi:transcriptional/translational regulatory protein YebC/TACO1
LIWQDTVNGQILNAKKRSWIQKKVRLLQWSRAIIVTARNGVRDPAGNFQLRTAIEKAKAAGLPNENIERAIAKGAGTLSGGASSLEAVRYEGYGNFG